MDIIIMIIVINIINRYSAAGWTACPSAIRRPSQPTCACSCGEHLVRIAQHVCRYECRHL